LGGILAGASAGSVVNGGLSDLLNQFRQSGHGDVAGSWVGNGPLSPADLSKALGTDQINTLMSQSGLSRDELLTGLSDQLPRLVNHLTPNGRMPPTKKCRAWFEDEDHPDYGARRTVKQIEVLRHPSLAVLSSLAYARHAQAGTGARARNARKGAGAAARVGPQSDQLCATGQPEQSAAIGRSVNLLTTSTDCEIDAAFASLIQNRADALLVSPDNLFFLRSPGTNHHTIGDRPFMPIVKMPKPAG
jgi:hypothetical protein